MNELITDNFEFRITKTEIYDEDTSSDAENTLLTVQVASNGFSAISTFDLNIESVAWFAKDLVDLYEKMAGSAELHDLSFGTPYIKFSIGQRGYIHVEGKFIDGSILNHKQEMTFENDFDQTYLGEYAYALFGEYKLYLQKLFTIKESLKDLSSWERFYKRLEL